MSWIGHLSELCPIQLEVLIIYLAGKSESFIVKLSVVQVNAFLGMFLGLVLMWGIVTPQREMVMFNAEELVLRWPQACVCLKG